jgi:hypothetical protein
MKTIGLAAFVALFHIAPLAAQPGTSSSARLAIRSGIVEVERGGLWHPIGAGEALNPGERVRTGTGSTAAIEIGPRQVITLNEQSQVQIGRPGSALVQLETGSMKVFSASNVQLAAKDALLETTEPPVDLELGYRSDKLYLTVFNGAVRNGSVSIRGATEDPSVRTYVAGRRSAVNKAAVADPAFYIFPYFLYGWPDPNDGKISPPVVNSPTHPAYRPTQIVPPMPDPLHVPTTKQ